MPYKRNAFSTPQAGRASMRCRLLEISTFRHGQQPKLRKLFSCWRQITPTTNRCKQIIDQEVDGGKSFTTGGSWRVRVAINTAMVQVGARSMTGMILMMNDGRSAKCHPINRQKKMNARPSTTSLAGDANPSPNIGNKRIWVASRPTATHRAMIRRGLEGGITSTSTHLSQVDVHVSPTARIRVAQYHPPCTGTSDRSP